MPDNAYAPYEPLNVLKPVAPDLWIVDGPEIRFRYIGMNLPFPTRMTVVRLPDGALWLHSPTAPEDTLVDALAALGPVRHLVAPNTIHYWWLPDWADRFPEAQTYGVEGLQRSAKRPLAIANTLTDTPPDAWAGTLDQVVVAGDLLTEADFFHRPSRTLILTDLIENFETERVRPWLYRQALRLAGAADPDGKAPIDMQLTFLRHRKTLRQAVERMISWAPERIVISHGRWYETDGTSELRRAFRWAL